MHRASPSLFDRIFGRPRPLWATALICLVLLSVPFLVLLLTGQLQEAVEEGFLRPLLLPVVLIAYIVGIAPYVGIFHVHALAALRTLAPVDGPEFDRIVAETERVNLRAELVAILVGMALGVLDALLVTSVEEYSLVGIYYLVAMAAFFGLLAWLIFVSVAGSRLNTRLHRLPLKVDLFDISPYIPVGVESLVSALIFIGGILLSVLFSQTVSTVLTWQTWAFYLPLTAVPVLIFFSNMRETHRLLASEKNRLLKDANDGLIRLNRQMRDKLALGENLQELAGEYSALSDYEKRLSDARTWPYNTTMLRTLVFTIFVPLLLKLVNGLFFD